MKGGGGGRCTPLYFSAMSPSILSASLAAMLAIFYCNCCSVSCRNSAELCMYAGHVPTASIPLRRYMIIVYITTVALQLWSEGLSDFKGSGWTLKGVQRYSMCLWRRALIQYMLHTHEALWQGTHNTRYTCMKLSDRDSPMVLVYLKAKEEAAAADDVDEPHHFLMKRTTSWHSGLCVT